MSASSHLVVLGLVILSVMLAAPAWGDSSTPAGASTAPHKPVRITCFGDSITEGYASSDPATRSYPAVLQKLLDEKYGKGAYVVSNAGISGQDTRQGLARVDQVLAGTKPDWVLIEYGTNDMWTNRHMSAAETGANLAKIVAAVKAAGAKPILATLTPVSGEDKQVAERNASIRKAAGEKGVPVADLNAAFEKAFDGAGGRDNKAAWGKYYAKEEEYLHPNDFGYAFLAGEWLKALETAGAADAK